ncbi:hypothetical protein A9Q74_17120 [Colwellia sp. 39_35_sub15_T18]|nr:hypothetical protein A9Q74_17120 [Colwellia sp. 39_35_sub15_T18]
MSYPQQQLTAEQVKSQLQTNGDFLQLTRSHEFSMPACSFEVVCTSSMAKSTVSVLDTGIIVFEPLGHSASKNIVLSSAVHGNETAPIEICSELIKQLILGELHLEHRTLFLFGNPASININQRFVEENLNRLFSSEEFSSKDLSSKEFSSKEFSGGHSLDQGQGAGLINKERHRALLLEKTVQAFFLQGSGERFHYDLHTAIRGSKNDKFAVYPYRHNKPWVKEQLQFMLACGVNTILFSNSPTTTFSYFSANNFDAHAFTVELGKVKAFGENDMTNFAEVTSSLTALISGLPLTLGDYNKEDFSFFEIDQIINRQHENFTLHFADDVENFTDFAIGTIIAIDGEQEIKTRKQGEAIIFPNANVAIGQRALLTVIPVEINPE